MERKGFKVTKDVGCLLPHSQYGKSITESGAKMNGCGYKTSMGFFTGLIGNHPSAPERDTDGRPISLEVSHLCHRSSCINPMHLVAEPKWCNLKLITVVKTVVAIVETPLSASGCIRRVIL